MLTIENGIASGRGLDDFAYIEGRGALGRQAMRLTRWLRAVHAGRFLPEGLEAEGRHLDIGCGDGYFLRRSPAAHRYGLDRKLGDRAEDGLPFPDGSLDVVTMLAVIEHIADPEPVLAEIHRVLVPGGRFILTTPRRAAEWVIALYARDIGEEHERYYTAESLRALAGDRFDFAGSRAFCAGLNQAFCLVKRSGTP
ncbi:class I SAM-dependent methyltransferase [Roseospira navarrensis]|uniref:Methyltransferase domain-containing protein n=1 Tax=Roseospira navarrensis TaxID=140058 RepID=A0A7X1ZGR4_9PROT|nr:class I SAM-dependent methyltransferase [Roseospira navarrensis]MQX38013.1 methyltransferase domain-containing protein [Roseospira navarrensis]